MTDTDFDGDNPFDALAESYAEFPRRTCPGGYDYAGHVCDDDCRNAETRPPYARLDKVTREEANDSAVLPDQVNRPGAPA